MGSYSKCKFRPSKHAKDKMIETGLSKLEILDAILRGAKRTFENKILSAFKGFEVIYRQFPCNYFIITVYWKK
ncbi:MAG: DUF4258 domain-containing protein [archaeon]